MRWEQGLRSFSRAGTAFIAAAGLAIAAATGASAALGAHPSPGAQPPAHPRFKTTAPAGTHNGQLLMNGWTDPKTGLNVRQNMWNCPNHCGAQTLWANSSSDWGIVSDQPKGNTAVLTGPDVQEVFTRGDDTPAPLRGFKRIWSTFTQSMPAQGDFEADYDIWLNNWNTEIMIWTDVHGQTPAGSPVATVSLYGQKWTLWKSSGSSGGYPSGPFSLVLHGNETKGTVHILATLDWLMAHRYVPANSAIDDVEYGWEICSTNGRAENFSMTSYAMHVLR